MTGNKRAATLTLAALCLSAVSATAQTTAPSGDRNEDSVGGLTAEDRAAAKARLFERLSVAETEAEARQIEDAIWRIWFVPPTDEIGALMDRALDRLRWYAYDEARDLLDQIVDQAPEYAEGWNQRAFVLFLQEKYDQSLADIDRVLALEPKHFGALSGRGRILLSQGRTRLGQQALRDAIAIHPFLPERALLPPSARGDDI